MEAGRHAAASSKRRMESRSQEEVLTTARWMNLKAADPLYDAVTIQASISLRASEIARRKACLGEASMTSLEI